MGVINSIKSISVRAMACPFLYSSSSLAEPELGEQNHPKFLLGWKVNRILATEMGSKWPQFNLHPTNMTIMQQLYLWKRDTDGCSW